MKRLTLGLIFLVYTSSHAGGVEGNGLLSCAINAVETHYVARQSEDIDALNKIHRVGIDWGSFDGFTHEIVGKEMTYFDGVEAIYIRVREIHEDKDKSLHMNFDIVRDGVGCGIVAFYADDSPGVQHEAQGEETLEEVSRRLWRHCW